MKTQHPKYLVCKLRALGDAVLGTATLGEIKRINPHAEVHYLLPEKWAPVFEQHPWIDRLWIYPDHGNRWKNMWARLRLIWQIRAEKFDFFIALHASKKTAWIARLSAARMRVVHNHNFFKKDYFTQKAIPQKNELRPLTERDLKALQALEMEVTPHASTRLSISPHEKRWAEEKILHKHGLKRPLLALGLGASSKAKIWPIERFAEVAKFWVEQNNGSVVAVVSSAEVKLLNELQKNYSSPQVLGLSNLSLRQMMAVLSLADVMLANDSGPRHSAAALGTPTLTLFGPQDPYEWHPYDKQKHPHLFVPNLACRSNVDPSGKYFWCGIQECIKEQHKCMKQLSSTEVIDTLTQLTQQN